MINLGSLFRKAYRTRKPQMWKGRDKTQTGVKRWVSLTHPNHPGKFRGEICVQIEVLTKEQATAKPAGPGREAPNTNPHLEPPVRPNLSLMDPIGNLKMLLGPEIFFKITCTCLCLCFCTVGVTLLFVAGQFKTLFA